MTDADLVEKVVAIRQALDA